MSPALSIQGTSSSAGKSLLTTALARVFARRGLRVAPFKAQNMSNNARVVDGGEIGVAQYLQALAAGVTPDVRMNPILVKPEADDRSQVVLMGRVHHELSRLPWRERPAGMWPLASAALEELLAENDLVLLEGAGSPAETNLLSTDLANMRAAEAARAPVVLVTDIDRGGAFAHLFGTWSLVGDHRERLCGFVLNRFRGDPSLLDPAPAELEAVTGMRYVGLLPYLAHGLPDEDGAAAPASRPLGPRVAVVRYPTASNLDELKPLERVAQVVWAGRPDDLRGAALVILPGSKHVAADLAWLRSSGVADAVVDVARSGGRVLGICGGLQMLGREVVDEGGVDGSAPGLGLLDVVTTFGRDKRTERVGLRFEALPAPWDALSGLAFAGYEIRHGETHAAGGPAGETTVTALADGRGFVSGPVLGISAHGLLEMPEAVPALLGLHAPAGAEAGLEAGLEAVFDALADAVEAHLDVGFLARAAGVG